MVDFYSRLLELRRAEGASRGLGKLPPDFYPQATAYLADTRKVYENELRENPSGKKGEVARQTHSRALQVARDLVEARSSKLLSAAFQASVGGMRELANALPEERAQFDRLVDVLRQFRSASAPYLEPTGAGPSGAPTPPHPSPPEPAARPLLGAPSRAPTTVFVRVLKGSPPVEFGGETIELRAEEVLTVAPDLARILIDGQLAEAIQASEEMGGPRAGAAPSELKPRRGAR